MSEVKNIALLRHKQIRMVSNCQAFSAETEGENDG